MPETYVAIDFEVSGYAKDSACAVGLARIEGNTVLEPFYTLLRPPSPIVLFSDIHKLTWEDLKCAPTFHTQWNAMADYIQGASYFIAHNAPFDRSVLAACLEHEHYTCTIPFLCTLRGARKALPKSPSKKLNVLCEYFAIPLNHHNACSDALACAHLFLKLKALGIADTDMEIRAKKA